MRTQQPVIHITASMYDNEKPVIGASIIIPGKDQLSPPHTTLPNPSLDTLTPCSSNPFFEATTKEHYDPSSSHPFSAFYSHPTTRTSFEIAKSQSNVHVAVYSHDLESGSRITQAESTHGGRHHKEDDKVWPCQRKMREKQLAKKRGKWCDPLGRLSKKQKIVVQTLIVLLLVGAITGLSIGISKAVGGGVFRTSNNSDAPIGNND